MDGCVFLSPQQIAFYEAFGYLALPGLFRDEIEGFTRAFEAVFADDSSPRIDLDVELHRNEPRVVVPGIIDRHPVLAPLRDDPRITGIVRDLLGYGARYLESDGNIYSCDSEWHSDIYGSPLEIRHVKLAFYLDPLRADSGAVRLIPGTNHWEDAFATGLRKEFRRFGEIPSIYGVDGTDIPCVTLDSNPGDLLLWDFRTIHASYGGSSRRRLFTLNFREPQVEGVGSEAVNP